MVGTAIETNVTPTAIDGTTLTSGAADTKGAWTELIASLGANTEKIIIEVTGLSASATDTSALIDIGTGAASSEVVRIGDANIGAVQAVAGYLGTVLSFVVDPTVFASGTRIAARFQCAVASDTCNVNIWCVQGKAHMESGTNHETVVADTADSGGVSHTGGSSAWGTWTSVGTITNDCELLRPHMSPGTDTTLTARRIAVKIGYGSSAPGSGGTEIDASWLFGTLGAETMIGPAHYEWVRASLTAGETLWVAAAFNGSAEARDFTISVCDATEASGGGSGHAAGRATKRASFW